MKQLEEMSREELIQEIIASSKRLEEIEAARKDEGQRIVELEKTGGTAKDIEKSISQGSPCITEAIPKLQELLKKKGEEITKLQDEIDAMEKGKLFAEIVECTCDYEMLMSSTIGISADKL